DLADLLVGELALQHRQQREVVLGGYAVGIAVTQPPDDGGDQRVHSPSSQHPMPAGGRSVPAGDDDRCDADHHGGDDHRETGVGAGPAGGGGRGGGRPTVLVDAQRSTVEQFQPDREHGGDARDERQSDGDDLPE